MSKRIILLITAILLLAHQGVAQHTVTFNRLRGSDVATRITTQSVISGQKVSKPTNPTPMTGKNPFFTFLGWYTATPSDFASFKSNPRVFNVNGTGEYYLFADNPFDFETPITSDLTLYALWEMPCYFVAGDKNIAHQDYFYIDTYLPNLSGNGTWYGGGYYPASWGVWNFDGWSNGPDNVELYTSEANRINKTGDYNITYNSNGGGIDFSYTVGNGCLAPMPAKKPVKGSLTFEGWFTEPQFTNKWNFNAPVTSNISLYAKWGGQSWTVTFDTQGGSAIEPLTFVPNGATISSPTPTPTMAGHNFGGWFTDPTCTLRWNFLTNTVLRDITLYAQWLPERMGWFVSGKIVDEVGNPIANVKVSLMKRTFPPVEITSALTDADGHYTIYGITPGLYNIESRLNGTPSPPASEFPRSVIGLEITDHHVVLKNLILRASPTKPFGIKLFSGQSESNDYDLGVKYGKATITNLTYMANNVAVSNDRENGRINDTYKTKRNMLKAAGARRYKRTNSDTDIKKGSNVGEPYEQTANYNLSLGYTWKRGGYTFCVEQESEWDALSQNYTYIVKRTGAPSPPQDPTGTTYYRVRGSDNKKANGDKILNLEDMHTVVFLDRMPNYPTSETPDATIITTWKIDINPFNPRYNQHFYNMYKYDEVDGVSGATVQNVMPWAIDADPQESAVGAYGNWSTSVENDGKSGGVDNNGNIVPNEQTIWIDNFKPNGTHPDPANFKKPLLDAGAKLVWDSPNTGFPTGGEIIRIDHPFSIKANYINPAIDMKLYANADNGFIAFLNGQYIDCSNSFKDAQENPRFGLFDFLDEEKVIKAMINPTDGRLFSHPPLDGENWNLVVQKKAATRLLNIAAKRLKGVNGNDSIIGYDTHNEPIYAYEMNNVLTIYAVNSRHVDTEIYKQTSTETHQYISDGNAMNNPAFVAYALVGSIDTDMDHLLVAEPTAIISYQGGSSRSGDSFPRPRFRYFKEAYDPKEDQVFHEYEIPQSHIEANKWKIGVADPSGAIIEEEYSPHDPNDPSEPNPKYPDLIYPDAPFRVFFYNGQVVLNGLDTIPVGVYRMKTIWDDQIKKISIDGQTLIAGTSDLNPIYTVVYPPQFIEVRPLTTQHINNNDIVTNINDIPDNFTAPYIVVPPTAPRADATLYTGAYGTEEPTTQWSLQTEEEKENFKFKPGIIFDDATEQEKVEVERVLSNDINLKDYGRPRLFFLETVNSLNGNVIIRPDINPNDDNTWITVVLPYEGKFTDVKLIHFPEVKRRILPVAEADPYGTYDRKWWADSLDVDNYIYHEEKNFVADKTGRQFRYKISSSGLFAILFKKFYVRYEYDNMPTLTPVTDPDPRYVLDQVVSKKPDATSSLAFFGWKDYEDIYPPVNSGLEVIPNTKFEMPERNVTLTGRWAVAQVKDNPTDSYHSNKYDNLYPTLSSAIAAAQPGQTVQLFVDVKENITIDKRLVYDSKFAGLPESVNADENSIEGSFTLVADAEIASRRAELKLHNDLLVDTIAIQAHIFGNKAQIDYNSQKIQASKSGYMDLTLPTTNNPEYGWYPINLPFAAEVAGVTTPSGIPLTHPEEFGIAEYNGARRATFGKGNQPQDKENDWLYIAPPSDPARDLTVLSTNIGNDQQMMANTAYMVNNRGSGLPLRIYSSGTNATLSAISQQAVELHSSTIGDIHSGWNYVAQTLGSNATVKLPPGATSTIIQVSESFSSDRENIGKQQQSYIPIDLSSYPNYTIAPYTNFFYQNKDAGYIELDATNANQNADAKSVYYREYNAIDRYELRLVSADNAYDALFVSTTPDPQAASYQIGRDVLKMGGRIANTLQIWSHIDGYDLCAVDYPLINGQADIPITLNMPDNQKYTLELKNPTNKNHQVWLMSGRTSLVNLIKTPTFSINGSSSPTNEFSLRVIGDEVREIELTHIYSKKSEIVIDGIEINSRYTVVNMIGVTLIDDMATSQRVSIPLPEGVYIVSTDNKHQKVVVR